MPSSGNRGIKIFIGVQEKINKVIVSIKLINDPENIHPDWYIQDLSYKNKILSTDGKIIFLTYNRNDYDSLGLTYKGKMYDYITNDLFYYLQTETSAFGKFQEETQPSKAPVFIGLALSLLVITGAIAYGFSAQNNKKIKNKK